MKINKKGFARKITVRFTLAALAIIVIYDIIIFLIGGGQATISDVALMTSYEHIILPFALGTLCGHLVWPRYGKFEAWHLWVLLGVVSCVASASVFLALCSVHIHPLLTFVPGFPTGHFFWSQNLENVEGKRWLWKSSKKSSE